jgi:hypothetical protein
MSTIPPPDFSTPIINSVHEVASQHLGKGLLNAFWNYFSADRKVRDGDYLLRRSRTLIRQYWRVLPIQDKRTILIELKE